MTFGRTTVLPGGLGVAMSHWRQARAVPAPGQPVVVSGTVVEQVFARRLQDGDPGC